MLAEAFDQGKIEAGDRFSVAELVTDLKNINKTAHAFATVEEIVQYLVNNCKKSDVILIMSNGGFNGIYQKLMTALA